MRIRRIVTSLFALGLPALVFVPVVLAAGEGKKPAGKGTADAAASAPVKKNDPENITSISLFMETCVEANKKYLSRDFPAAIELYRKAIQLAPKNPLGHYLLGEAQLASGNLSEAEASWKQAELSADSRDPTLRARVLFVLADTKERQKKWDEAKAAWQAYSEWAGKFPDAGAFPASAAARIQAIDTAIKQDKAYEVVRQRIKDTADGGVFTDPEAGVKGG